MFRDGTGVAKDEARAVELYRRAADHGFVQAELDIAFMYVNGRGVERDMAQATAWFLKAAKANNGFAMMELGWLSRYGSEQPRDDIKAYVWYRLAIQAGNNDAHYWLGDLLANAGNTADSKLWTASSQARNFFYAEGRKNFALYINEPNGSLRHALVAAKKQVVPRDPDGSSDKHASLDRQAKDYATLSIVMTDEFLAQHAELALHAVRLAKGPALTEATDALQRAIAGGSVQAMLLLAELNLREDPVAAASQYRQSSFSSDDQGIKFVGSAARAAELYAMAVAKGSNAARVNLGVLHELGHGVGKNLAMAEKLYREAMAWKDNGPAQIGLLRLSLQDVWEREASAEWATNDQLLRDSTPGPASANDILVEPVHDMSTINITDALGHRVFSGFVNSNRPYRVASGRDDLILWPGYMNDVQVRFGGKIIHSSDSAAAGIRLDRKLLAANRDPFIMNRDEDNDHWEHLPDETLLKSRIKIHANTDSNIFVHDDQNLFGIEFNSMNAGRDVRLPDIPGLTLVVRPFESYKSETRPSTVSVIVDGSTIALPEITAPPNCWVTVRLDLDRLRQIHKVNAARLDCQALAENSPVPYLTDEANQVVSTAERLPDEHVNGVIAGFLRLNKGISRLQMTLGGRADERYRADRIFLAQDLRQYGPNSFETIQSEMNLADSEIALGLIQPARSRLDDALNRLGSLGTIPPDFEASLFRTYGSVLLSSGRYLEAERFFVRSNLSQRKSNEANRGPPQSLVNYHFLSTIAERLGDFDRALMYTLQAQLLLQADLPERSDDYNREFAPTTLVRIIDLLHRLDRNEEANDILDFAHVQAKRDIVRDVPEPLHFPLDLTVFERTFGKVERSDNIASVLGYLGTVYSWMGRHEEALPLLRQVTETRTNVYGEGNPSTAIALAKYADEELAVGDREKAIDTARTAFDSLTKFLALRAGASRNPRGGMEALGPAAFSLLGALYGGNDPGSQLAHQDEAFEVVQRLQNSSAAIALREFGVRLQERESSKRDQLRRIQDLGDELSRLDASLIGAVSASERLNEERIARIKDTIRKTEAELEVLTSQNKGKLDKTQDEVASYQQIKRLLQPNEALVTIANGIDASFVFVATRDRLKWFRSSLNMHDLKQKVATLRCGVDAQQWIGESRLRCMKATNATAAGSALPFSLTAAHDLYQDLLEPVEDVIAGKDLIFALSGPLSGLPLEILVTRRPSRDIATSPADFANVDWLINGHAISILPSVASLTTLRLHQDARATIGVDRRLAYIGLGDPSLTGDGDCPKIKVPRQCAQLVRSASAQSGAILRRAAIRPTGSYFRGDLADVQSLRQICPLPETATELRCVSKSVGGANDRLVLGEQLTETEIKRLPLDRYRIIHFATHGLLADQTRTFGDSVGEPALVLTPPKTATPLDDGLLTASEIAQLKLNADWAILSACNTAASRSLETDALSGLARAFFFAGARLLLVSHWSVDSSATVILISRAFRAMALDRSIKPAQALRESLVSMIADPPFAHPARWAPFVLIGDSNSFSR
nr:CHAT domain-containing protein [Bradyrhizobium sp. AS23.2]